MLTAVLGSKRRGRRKGVAVRPGSVLQARKEAGLTLAQVAAGGVTRAAIHLIETGRSRPSFETLELIAERTNRPLEFFLLEAQSVPSKTGGYHELRELERLTMTREFRQVLDLGVGLLDKPWSPETLGQLRFYLGQAYCRLFQAVAALDHLSAARATFEQLGDEWMAVEALDWEASAMGLVDDPRAIPCALEALERCRRLKPRPGPTEARILGHIAGMYVSAHSWSQAMRYYEAALEAAGSVKDILQLAKTHHGLGTVYQRMNQPVRASQHFDRALALYSIESDLSAVYRVENDMGELLLREGNLESAEVRLHNALLGSDQLGIDRKVRGYVMGNLAEVSMRKGDRSQAVEYLRQALEAGESTGDEVVIANAHMLRGDLEEANHDRAAADHNFAAAIQILQYLKIPDRLREAQMHVAEVLEARGDMTGAARHWRAAAEVGTLRALGRPAAGAAAEAQEETAAG